MDRDLEHLLRAILERDPHSDLDDKAREKIVYATIGMISDDDYKAVWRFSKTIADEFKRSYIQNWLSHKLASRFPFRVAEEIARSIELPYWKWNAVAEIASEKLKWHRSTPNHANEFLEEGFALIREAQLHLSEIPDEDRSSLISKLGHTLIEAERMDWAEEIASTNEYDPESTDVLLRIAKATAQKGAISRAVCLAEGVAQLAQQTDKFHEHPAFDLLAAGSLLAALGKSEAAIKYLEDARVRALTEQTQGNLEGTKCLAGVAEELAKAGRMEAAREVVEQITVQTWRERALNAIVRLPMIQSQ